MCELLLGFEHLHDNDIVFRDLKPENILIDMDGHLRIADFGLARRIPKKEKSYSFCGSPEYLSPEMLQNLEGHDRRLDIFCLGVLLYEMLTGLPPFYDEQQSRMFHKIMSIHPNMNLAYLSLNVRNLMSKLLQKNPNQRPQSITEIKSHPWFNGVNWNDIIAKKIKPPLIPDLFKSNFEQDCLSLPLDFDESTQSKVRSSSFYHETDHIGDGSTGAGPIERH